MNDKRRPIFIGVSQQVIHGQLVEVKHYTEVDPDPTLGFDKILEDICGASAVKLEAIKATIASYKRSLKNQEYPDFHDTEFIYDDEFLDTRAENKLRYLGEFEKSIDDRYIPLHTQLRELGIE